MALPRSSSPTASPSAPPSTATAFGRPATTSPRMTSSSWPRRWGSCRWSQTACSIRGRLQPAKTFLFSLEEGRIVDDVELKAKISTEHPYGEWLERNLRPLESFPEVEPPARMRGEQLLEQQIAFGYTVEDLKQVMAPMMESGAEPIGSMGNDTPLAVLSDRAQPLYNYFKHT